MGEYIRSLLHVQKSKNILSLLFDSFNCRRHATLTGVHRTNNCRAVAKRWLYFNHKLQSQNPQHSFDVKEEHDVDDEKASKIVLKDNKEDDANDKEDEYTSALLEYYAKKAKNDVDYMDDVEYHDIQDVNKRVFYKIVDIWLKEVGATKAGHRDFIQTLLNSVKRFNVEADIKAYLKLLDCFPDGKHTGLKRSHWFKAAYGDKLADHALGVRLLVKLSEMKAVPNDKLFNKTTDLFGRFSPVAWTARAHLFWYPKLMAANPFPISRAELKLLTPIEIAFYGLRQMNPGIDCHYHNFSVNKAKCDEVLGLDKIDTVLSAQTDEQISLLAEHDPSTPVYIEGPFISYFNTKRVQYYTMRSDPKGVVAKKPKQRTTTLSTKEWFEEFYETDWETNRLPVHKIKEEFFPVIDVVDGYHDVKIHEIAQVDKDTDRVEGSVYAIACTDFNSSEALLSWVRGLLPQNPILRECSIVLREEDSFMINTPKDDPNEGLYEDIELPYYY